MAKRDEQAAAAAAALDAGLRFVPREAAAAVRAAIGALEARVAALEAAGKGKKGKKG